MTLNMPLNKALMTITLAGLLSLSTAFYAHSDQQETDESKELQTGQQTEQIIETSTETSTEETAKTTEKATEQTTEQTTDSDKQDAAIASKTAGAPDDAKTKKNDTFIPSESISEDLAVSFPIDI